MADEPTSVLEGVAVPAAPELSDSDVELVFDDEERHSDEDELELQLGNDLEALEAEVFAGAQRALVDELPLAEDAAGPESAVSPAVLDSHVEVEGQAIPAARNTKREFNELSGRWGSTHIYLTFSDAVKKPPHGQWMIRCPYHKKSSVTACTKSMALDAPTAKEKDEVKRRLMEWALLGPTFTRKSHHGNVQPRQWKLLGRPILSEAVLDAKAQMLPLPPADLKTDAELGQP